MNDGITSKLSPHSHVIAIVLFNAKVGIFPPSYAVIPSFISCFTTWIPKLIIFKYTSYSIQLYKCDCSIRVTVHAVVEYLKSATVYLQV